MTSRPIAMSSMLGFVGIGATAAFCAWWSTGVPPFSLRAYVAVGLLPLMLLVAAMIAPVALVLLVLLDVPFWAGRRRAQLAASASVPEQAGLVSLGTVPSTDAPPDP